VSCATHRIQQWPKPQPGGASVSYRPGEGADSLAAIEAPPDF
jgi:hypothetical protein